MTTYRIRGSLDDEGVLFKADFTGKEQFSEKEFDKITQMILDDIRAKYPEAIIETVEDKNRQ